MRGLTVGFIAILCVSASSQPGFAEEGGTAHSTGCVAIEDVENSATPADISLGVRDCLAEGYYNAAIELFLLMGLRANFDTLRVVDDSAHWAGASLSEDILDALSDQERYELQGALEWFGGTGSVRHQNFCTVQQAATPPDYHPEYMISQGFRDRSGDKSDELVAGFDAPARWQRLLVDFLECPAA